MDNMDKIALITGANKGIGLEIGKELLKREWTVIFTGPQYGCWQAPGQ